VFIHYQNSVRVEISGDEIIDAGSSTTLLANVTPADGNYEYSWSPPDLVDVSNAPSVISTLLDNSTMFSVQVSDINTGCVATDSLWVEVENNPNVEINIRNGVTPNNDGKNDIWYIEKIENFPDNEVIVYNRWGDELQRFRGYNNTFNYWDGRNKNGELVPDGTYYYLIDLGGDRTYTGWVQVRTDN
jgi:gliding motility-associated-like protein